MFDGEPLWFLSDDLLTSVLHAEIHAVMQLLAKHPDLPNQFDTPDAAVGQRNACFALLAHLKVIGSILDTLAGRYIEPSLSDEESQALRLTYNVVADDAPAWALEMQRVIDRLPAHIYASLPEPLRRGGYNPDDTEQMEAIESAKKTLNTIEQIQALTERMIDQQLQKLLQRWSSGVPQSLVSESREPKKRKSRRTRDKVRVNRDKLIAEIDDVAQTNGEFLQLMDERMVKPQPTWSGWPGSWRKAYSDLRLRKLIHQDKSRALARVGKWRNR